MSRPYGETGVTSSTVFATGRLISALCRILIMLLRDHGPGQEARLDQGLEREAIDGEQD